MSVRLYEGAIGTTRLRTADARAAIDAAQKLDFGLELAPAESRHSSGHLKVSGVVPLSEVTPPSCASHHCLDCRRTLMHTWWLFYLAVFLFCLVPGTTQESTERHEVLARTALYKLFPAPHLGSGCLPTTCCYLHDQLERKSYNIFMAY